MIDTHRLRKLRKRQGYSQKALAEALGIHQTAVSAWERGVCAPSLASFDNLTKLLQADPACLLDQKPRCANATHPNSVDIKP